MAQTLTEGDEGKSVVDAEDNEIGTIDRVEHVTDDEVRLRSDS